MIFVVFDQNVCYGYSWELPFVGISSEYYRMYFGGKNSKKEKKKKIYRIRPNYHTVHLGFSKLLGTIFCGKMCIYLLRIHYKKDQKNTYLMVTMQFFSDFLYKSICCGYLFELSRCICLYKEVDKKYTGCNLKTMELLDCMLTGVCALDQIRYLHLHYIWNL